MAVINAAKPDFLTRLLVCCRCKSDLEMAKGSLHCTACRARYPIKDGIPRFIRLTEGKLDKSHPIEHRKDYEHRFQDPTEAQGYRDSFTRTRRNIHRTQRELNILEQLLSSQSKCDSILDVPCGGGRLSAPLCQHTKHLIEADAAAPQVKLALDNPRHSTELFGITVSALELPFDNASIDGTLCGRLSHHFPSPQERASLLKEMLRVSRRFVIFSYTDRWSTQTFFRAIAGRAINPATMTKKDIANIACQYGGQLERILTVFALGSRHRFALIKKP